MEYDLGHKLDNIEEIQKQILNVLILMAKKSVPEAFKEEEQKK